VARVPDRASRSPRGIEGSLSMRKPRTFTSQFKREVVEELLSRTTGQAQLARRYNLSSGLLYHWKNQYARGKFNNEPTAEAALRDRVNQLEQILGRITLENEFLKKALENTLKEQREKESSLILTRASSPVSKGDVG